MKVVLQNLTKKFPPRTKKDNPVTAVDNFNFEIPDGYLVGLLGPSGCGKSTCLNLICGLEVPTSGKIFFGDEDITELPPEKRGVGLVFQNYALYPHLSVRENIRFPLENLKGDEKLSKEEMNKRVDEAAKLVQIEGLMERKPSQMSGGQQQRVAIARALVKTPRVLLLDEPLSNLDARLRLQTREEIRRIQQETGVTTVFVTHDQEEAMSICDLIVVMKDGALHQIGAPQEVYDNPVNLFVAQFLGSPQINTFDAEVKGGKLYIGGEKIMDIFDIKGVPEDYPDGPVYAAIRPEGFKVDANGPMECNLRRIGVMGRDTSVISSIKGSLDDAVRSIVPAEDAAKIEKRAKTVSFSVKPEKIFLFDKETSCRIGG